MNRFWLIIVVICIGILCLGLIVSGPWGLCCSKEGPKKVINTPERIVSLAPNLTEILFCLGLGDKVVAVSSDSDYPAKAAQKIKVGSFWQPNTEVIITSKPDLVVGLWFDQQRTVADALRRLGYEVLTLKVENLDEMIQAIQSIGDAANCRKRAGQLVDKIKKQIKQLSGVSCKRPKVLWVIQAEPLRVAGRKTFVNELIELAGGQNAIGPTIDRYPSLNSEAILSCGAEIIIQSAMTSAAIETQQESAEKFWSRFPHLPAVKNKRIYVVNPDTILRLGPRIPQGIKLITEKLHPENYQQE
ncbi:MAG: ABC transporter substrate-binding protein [Sedimentisphaerales bacterium]|nr:ABC transporter substrate-binding protein [Sedimentisphaerales bacterium]